jgi:ankyrin repeat protein
VPVRVVPHDALVRFLHILILLTQWSRVRPSHCSPQAVVSALLNAKADVQATDTASGSTALMYASAFGHLSIVRMLVEAGAQLSARDGNGHTALSIAEQYGQAAVAEYLGTARSAMERALHDDQEALLEAAVNGDVPTVSSLLETMDLPTEPIDPEGGETALILASGRPKCEGMVRSLLTANADVHARDHAGWTALLWASDAGNAATVKLLLSAGADVHAMDLDGNTALDLATLGERAQSTQHMRVAALLRAAAARGKTRSGQQLGSARAVESTACSVS